MATFTAQDARELVTRHSSLEFDSIIAAIKEKANSRQTTLHIYNSPLNDITIKQLELAGFRVTSHPDIVNHRDELYHTIQW